MGSLPGHDNTVKEVEPPIGYLEERSESDVQGG
jgi:hypothetical protein